MVDGEDPPVPENASKYGWYPEILRIRVMTAFKSVMPVSTGLVGGPLARSFGVVVRPFQNCSELNAAFLTVGAFQPAIWPCTPMEAGW